MHQQTVVAPAWGLIFLFMFAAFFVAFIWRRGAPSGKSFAIGSFVAGIMLVPLLLIGAFLFFYISLRSAPVPAQRVVVATPDEIMVPELEPTPPPVFIPQTPQLQAEDVAQNTPPSSPADAQATAAADHEAESTAAAAPSKPKPKTAAPSNPRPAWVGFPPKLTGGIYRTTVTVGPFATREECDRALPAELLRVTNNYIDNFLGEGASRWVHLPPGYVMEPSEQHTRVVNGVVVPQNSGYSTSSRIYRDQWQEEILASFGPMIQVHTLLEFNEQTRHDLQQRYKAGRAEGRLGVAGLGAGIVLLLLGTVFGYLKIDTATRGYYTRRLQFVAVLAILTTLAVGLSLVRGVTSSQLGF